MKLRTRAALALIALGALVLPTSIAAHADVQATWTTTPMTVMNPTLTLDGAATTAKIGSYVYWINVEPDTSQGAYATAGYDLKWEFYRGTTMDNLSLWKTFRPKNDGGWATPNGDDAYWPVGLWVAPNGDWYTTVHTEFNYNNGVDNSTVKTWFRRIGVAKSSDQGTSWTNLGDIVVSDNPTDHASSFPGKYVDLGPGDHHLYTDVANGYFYVLYDHNWSRKAGQTITPAGAQTARIARAPISGSMAPGTWTKWYDGAWTEPALGGRDSDLTFPSHNFETLTYNTYLGKYLGIGKKGSDVTIATATSLDEMDWTPLSKLADVAPYGFYIDPWDPSTESRDITDASFRLYTGSGAEMSARHTTVNLGAGVTPSGTYNPVFPGESVADANTTYDAQFLRFESESLPITASHVQANYPSDKASNRSYNVVGTTVGGYATYTIDVPTTGLYKVVVGSMNNSNRGKATLKIGGVQQGPEINYYASAGRRATYDLGLARLNSGSTAFRFDVTGTTGANAHLGIDDIQLIRQQEFTFDSDTTGSAPSGWIVGGITPPTVQAIPSASDKSVRLLDSSTTAEGWMYYDITPQGGSTKLEYRLLQPTAADWFRASLKDGSATIATLYTKAGNLVYRNATGADVTLQSYAANTWYKIRIEANPVTDRMSIFVNDVLRADNVPLQASAGRVTALSFGSGGSTTAATYINDVRVLRP